jgi:spore germination protein GerM
VRRLVAAVAVAGGAMGCAAGCGLPVDSHPRPISSTDVPYGLVAPSSTSTAVPHLGPTTPLYFVRRGRLQLTRQHVLPGPNIPEAALRQLLNGPTPADVQAGDTTSVPTQTKLISLDVAGTVGNADLTKEFTGIGGSDQILAVAQIVLTLTSSPQIRSVTFAIDGQPIEVPDGVGSLSSRPRTAADYAGLTRAH